MWNIILYLIILTLYIKNIFLYILYIKYLFAEKGDI